MEVTYSRNDKLISRKFYQYLIPTVLMILAMQFGSLADSIVIGNFLGEDALSAASLALPVVFLVELPGFTIAAGAGIAGANFIGKRMVKETSQTFKLALFLSFVASLVFIPLGVFVSDPLATWLAGNFQELKEMMRQYIAIYMYQAPVLGIGLTVAYFLPSDNSPVLGALYFLIANVVHIAAEIIFVVALPKETAMYGVAAAMGIGMVAGLAVLVFYFRSKRRTIDFTTPLKGSFHLTKDLLRAGSSTAAITALSFVFYLVLNLAATAYLAVAEMPVFAMLMNMSFVIDLFLIGALQVMPSVIPALFGEKDYFAIRSITKKVFLIGLGVAIVLTTVSLVFPQLFFYIFGVNLNESQLLYGVAELPVSDPLTVIRIYTASFALYAVNKFIVYYYPSIMINSPGVVSNVARFGIVGPVSIYFLMKGLGVVGYAYGVILMEGASLLIVLAFIFIGKKLGRFNGAGLSLLPKPSKDVQSFDISIPADEKEISKAVEELQNRAFELCQNQKSAAMLAIASEEIIANAISYGYRRKLGVRYIDVNLTRDEDKLLVRIRDDGIAFDPTIRNEEEEDEEMRFHGIEVVRKVASDFKYLRVLDTNNTIMEIKINQ